MPDEQRAAMTESADEELARLRRLAIVEELLTTLVGVLDVREVFAQVSEVARRVLKHDALAIPVITEDRQHAIPLATAGPAAAAYPSTHPIPASDRHLLTDPWEFEIVDDLQATPERERHSASLGYRSLLRVPIRLDGELAAVLVVLSRTPAIYQPGDAAVARRIADYVALALSHKRLADHVHSVEELRARTAALELLDELLTTLIDTGELHDVFDRISAIARKVLEHDTLALTVIRPDGKRGRIYASSSVDGKPFPESSTSRRRSSATRIGSTSSTTTCRSIRCGATRNRRSEGIARLSVSLFVSRVSSSGPSCSFHSRRLRSKRPTCSSRDASGIALRCT